MSQISNPYSTGGGGSTFELRTQAAFIATMLVNGRFPCLPQGKAEYIRLQARQLGYETDDLLILLQTPEGSSYKLLSQIKHQIAFSASDETFSKVLTACWKDFTNTALFIPAYDRIALITGPIPSTVVNHVRPLLDWSKHSRNASEFLEKVKSLQFSSRQKQKYLLEFRKVLDQANGDVVTDDQLWHFLRVFNLLDYDYDQSESADLKMLFSMLELGHDSDNEETVEALWGQLIVYTQEANQNAATVMLESIPQNIRNWFRVGESVIDNLSIKRLIEHGKPILVNIDDKIGQKVHLDRREIVDQVLDLVIDNSFVLVTGVAGIGKSALVKNLLSSFPVDKPVFVFKSEEFNYPHVDTLFTNIGVKDSLYQLSSRFSLLPEKVLFIDALEKIFELTYQDAFMQLLQIIKEDTSWRVIATCRVHAVQLLRDSVFFPAGFNPAICYVPPLSDDELAYVGSEIQNIVPLIENKRLNRLLRIPFYLRLCGKMQWENTKDIKGLDENRFKQVIWENVIERKTERHRGLPYKRGACFLDIAIRRAKSMSVFVSQGDCDPEALQKLVSDEVLVQELKGPGFAPAHDLFEDWALIKYVDERWDQYKLDPSGFFNAIGNEPAMRRSFRIWLTDKVNDPQRTYINTFITDSLRNETLPQYWKDEIITSILLSQKSDSYFNDQEEALLENNAALLMRIIHLLRTACKAADEQVIRSFGILSRTGEELFSTIFLRPTGTGWGSVIKFIHKHIDIFNLDHLKTILGVLQDWSQGIKREQPLPDEAREAGQIALHFLEIIKDTYDDKLQTDLFKIILKVPKVFSSEISDLVNEAFKNHKGVKSHYLRNFLNLLLDSFDCAGMCQDMPEVIYKTALKRWLLPHGNVYDRHRYSSDINNYFGLTSRYECNYFPASGLQGPFLFMLRFHPAIAIDLIIKLCNHATEKYAKSKFAEHEVTEISLRLNDDRMIKQWGSGRLWGLYRGTSVGPDLLQSALMALENWLLDQIESQQNISFFYDRLLEESNSVAITSVLVSIAIAYPHILAERSLPLLRTREFFHWDIVRQVHDERHIADIRPLIGVPTGGIDDVHYQERKKASSREHRRKHLEHLALNLQVTNLKESIFRIIDDYHRELPPPEMQNDEDQIWRIALKRMDLRQYTPEVDKEN